VSLRPGDFAPEIHRRFIGLLIVLGVVEKVRESTA
jgi:hypothetical protein